MKHTLGTESRNKYIVISKVNCGQKVNCKKKKKSWSPRPTQNSKPAKDIFVIHFWSTT